jgi:hypothetical protein
MIGCCAASRLPRVVSRHWLLGRGHPADGGPRRGGRGTCLPMCPAAPVCGKIPGCADDEPGTMRPAWGDAMRSSKGPATRTGPAPTHRGGWGNMSIMQHEAGVVNSRWQKVADRSICYHFAAPPTGPAGDVSASTHAPLNLGRSRRDLPRKRARAHSGRQARASISGPAATLSAYLPGTRPEIGLGFMGLVAVSLWLPGGARRIQLCVYG